MAIDNLESRTSRKGVAWLGSAPPAQGKSAFEDRGFRVAQCTAADLNDPAYLAGLAAVIFTQSATKLWRIWEELKAHALQLINYDCQIIIQSHEQPQLNGRRFIMNAVGQLRLWTVGLNPEEADRLGKWVPRGPGLPPQPYARVFPNSVPWSLVANLMLEHPPGACPNPDLLIDGIRGEPALSPVRQLLLRRAFWDCAEIRLAPMDDDGRSGASVYRAYAELAQGHYRRWPVPYFVKISSREQISVEYDNYESYVDPYVPFHLGPHLNRERCCLGAHEGIIVGDYVEGSESLLHCARDGRAALAIACLFERTLDGWYRGAAHKHEQSARLGRALLRWFPRRISTRRMNRAGEFGATKDLEELRALFQCCDSLPVLVGPIHGDLHAQNVRVRGTDAIMIDFFRHDFGPLVWDAASLEASLLIDGFADRRAGARQRPQDAPLLGIDDLCLTPSHMRSMDADVQTWLDSVEPLYDRDPLRDAPPIPNPKDAAYWFYTCVRQIRLHARRMESGPHQYAAVLALALLTKATKESAATEPEASRRAAAYVLAERLLTKSFGPDTGEFCI